MGFYERTDKWQEAERGWGIEYQFSEFKIEEPKEEREAKAKEESLEGDGNQECKITVYFLHFQHITCPFGFCRQTLEPDTVYFHVKSCLNTFEVNNKIKVLLTSNGFVFRFFS